MNRTLRYALVAGCLAVVLAAAFAWGVPETAKAEDAPQKLISVTGEAKMEVKPDMATVSLGVENTAKAAQDAQRDNSLKMNAVIDALSGMGIAKEDIRTSSFSLYPLYEWQGEKPNAIQTLVGYRCNNTVTVRLKDVAKVGLTIDTAVTVGATNVGDISFGLQNTERNRNAMLTAAVKDAQSKADIMARAAGLTITGVYRMSDGYTSVEPVGRGVYGYGDVSATPAIEPGSMTIRASVRIDFTF